MYFNSESKEITTDIENEIWKDVVGFEGVLIISSFGRVYSIVRKRIINPYISSNGYLVIGTPTQAGKPIREAKKKLRVHRLVGAAFIDNPHNKPVINHIDGCKTNNNVNNLEWVTYSDNARHAFATGLKVNQKGENAFNAKLTSKDIEYIRSHYVRRSLTNGANALGKLFNVSGNTIRDILANKRYKDETL